ncbi:hypothetical protein SAMN04487950_1120 [Halogranum rubrum]|uniref:L-alanine-DL-glutamate epimerase n=1 Tax=Halogranum rubrum TaxID=553466 RepID=A0A1I4CDX8_9EURY|nr:hypothetical protein [Halogranum rubrum]SFK79384.1 hypothetical protein SAMN04487950_1120 [Halogranum rubrum]
MTLFDSVADYTLVVESSDRTRNERDTSSGFVRATTVYALHGDGETGHGEDVTYDTEDHDALADAPPLVGDGDGQLAPGEYTFAEFSAALDGVELFPTKDPERETAHHYRRWAVESAGLDLALRQAGTNLGSAVDRDYDPVDFVVSTRLGEPPSTDRVEALLDQYPETELKLDPTSEWTEEIVEALAETDAVRILDLKGQYEGTDVDQDPDPTLYELVFDNFPNAVVEDPGMSASTDYLVEDNASRISWDYPITGVESVESLPFEPQWLNVKPSRFGTVKSLFDTLDYAAEKRISLYGGGQFELGVGRDQIQALASLFYADGPNDVAPGVYNDPDVPEDAPTSPLSPSASPEGLGF